MAESKSPLTAREAVESFVVVYKQIMEERNFKGYDVQLMNDVRVIDADSAGGVTWEMTVTEYWSNVNGVMHGGAYGVIFAIAMNPLAKVGYWDFLAGVTRTLNISYLKAVPLGATIRIRAKVLQHGKTTALIRGIIESLDGKTIYATAEHHKIHVPTIPEYASRLVEFREKLGKEKMCRL